MVLVITRNDPSKPFSDLARTVVLPALKLGLYDLELRNHPLRRRDSPDGKGSAARELPTVMGEPQKDEGLRFSFEVAPRLCFELNGRRLPFGCHGWHRYDRTFWEPYLLHQ